MGSEKECQPKAGAGSSTSAGQRAESGSPCRKKLVPPASLRSGKRIGEILKNGSRISGKSMNIVFLGRESGGGIRLAVLVPKRTGDAVRRNRVRRILREEFRNFQGLRERPVDIVLFWRRNITPESSAQAHEEAKRLLARLG